MTVVVCGLCAPGAAACAPAALALDCSRRLRRISSGVICWRAAKKASHSLCSLSLPPVRAIALVERSEMHHRRYHLWLRRCSAAMQAPKCPQLAARETNDDLRYWYAARVSASRTMSTAKSRPPHLWSTGLLGLPSSQEDFVDGLCPF